MEYYHNHTANTLESDLDEGSEPGYSETLNNNVKKLYNTDDWKVAYKKAYEYHIKQGNEFEAQAKKWLTNYNLETIKVRTFIHFSGDLDLSLVTKPSTTTLKWIYVTNLWAEDELVLGGEPMKQPPELPKPSKTWLADKLNLKNKSTKISEGATEERSSRFHKRAKDLEQMKQATKNRWEDIVTKLIDLYVKKVIDLTLKEIQKNLKVGQTKANVDAAIILKNYNDNIWVYIEKMLEKTKYADALLPDLKDSNMEIWEMVPYGNADIIQATEYLYNEIVVEYIEEQGFGITDVVSKNIPLTLPISEIEW